MSTTTTYKVIGTRPVRHDGADKVTGRALYGADATLPVETRSCCKNAPGISPPPTV